jgi:hypothetical protein
MHIVSTRIYLLMTICREAGNGDTNDEIASKGSHSWSRFIGHSMPWTYVKLRIVRRSMDLPEIVNAPLNRNGKSIRTTQLART